MSDPYRYPNRLTIREKQTWDETDVFQRQGILESKFKMPDQPHLQNEVIQQVKTNLVQDKLYFYPDDLAIPEGNKVHHLVRITREGGGIPMVDPNGPRPREIVLAQHGMKPYAQELYRYARKHSLTDLSNQIDIISESKDYKGYSKSDLDAIYRDAWIQIAPAINALGSGPNSLVDSNNTVSGQHRDFLRKYIYSKALKKLEAPAIETGRQEDSSFGKTEPYHLLPWPAQSLLIGDSKEGDFWGMSSQDIVQELYLDSHWLVNMPGRPGQKRFIPKNIPFSYATEYTSSDLEHYLQLWNEFGRDFEDRYIATLSKDVGSNIQIYTDLSKSGNGISFFARNRSNGAIDELKETLMTWQEFGDFIAMEAEFSFLKDLGEWWKQQDEWFEGIPVLNLVNELDAVKWMQKPRIMKLIDVIKSDEDKIFREGGKESFVHTRNLISADHIDEGSLGSLYLNKFGINRDGSENMDELASWWLLSPILRGTISTAKWFGLSPEEWRNEINWTQSYFGGRTELGQMGREVALDFLKAIYKEYPDITKMSEEDFDRIRNQEMHKRVLTRADYFDRVKSKATIFGKWASDIAESYRRGTYTPKTGTPVRPDPNRTSTQLN